MRKIIISLAALVLLAQSAAAHVTPNVQLVRRGDFLKESLPGATSFFEKPLTISNGERAAIQRDTGWSPSEQDIRVYVGRDRQGRLVGSVVFLWVSSQHGPLAIGTAFGPDERLLRVAVNDVSGEALPWVRMLIDAGALDDFAGLSSNARPDPEKIAPRVDGAMSRYYARVIADAVVRAQAVERVAHEKP